MRAAVCGAGLEPVRAQRAPMDPKIRTMKVHRFVGRLTVGAEFEFEFQTESTQPQSLPTTLTASTNLLTRRRCTWRAWMDVWTKAMHSTVSLFCSRWGIAITLQSFIFPLSALMCRCRASGSHHDRSFGRHRSSHSYSQGCCVEGGGVSGGGGRVGSGVCRYRCKRQQQWCCDDQTQEDARGRALESARLVRELKFEPPTASLRATGVRGGT